LAILKGGVQQNCGQVGRRISCYHCKAKY